MDNAMQNAIIAVQLDDETSQERWFEAICTTHAELAEAGEPDWQAFTSSLTEKAVSAGISTEAVEQFIRHMDDTDVAPLETIAKLRERSTELSALYREHAGGAEPAEGAGEGEGYDEAAWNTFLAEHGAYWNGDDTTWEQFTTWFHYQAEQNNLAAPAREFITYVESQPDKAAVFTAYGIPINKPDAGAAESTQDTGQEEATPDTGQVESTPDVSQFPEVKPGDTGEWVDYLDAMLTSKGF